MPPWLLVLLNPKVLFVYGPLSATCLFEGVALVYLYKRHEVLHTEYLNRIVQLKDEYMQLAVQTEKTLDILIKVLNSGGK